MSLVVELQNSANWTLFDSQSFVSIDDKSPLPEYTPLIQFDKHILAIYVSNADARSTWHFGGFVTQKIGLGIGPSKSAESISNRKLWLHRTQLLIFSELTTTYTLSIRFPSWFRKADCTIWEYSGPLSDSVSNQVADVQLNLLSLNKKVDTLLAR